MPDRGSLSPPTKGAALVAKFLRELRGALIGDGLVEGLLSLLRRHWDNEPWNWSAGLPPGAINLSLARRIGRSWSSALRFMESLLSLFHMHWDHEPRRGGRWRASILDCGSPLPLLRPRTRSESARGLAHSKTSRCAGWFMESRHTIASAPEEADYIRPNVGQASRLPRARASASGMTSVPQASPLGGRRDACPTGKEIHGQGFHRCALCCRKDS